MSESNEYDIGWLQDLQHSVVGHIRTAGEGSYLQALAEALKHKLGCAAILLIKGNPTEGFEIESAALESPSLRLDCAQDECLLTASQSAELIMAEQACSRYPQSQLLRALEAESAILVTLYDNREQCKGLLGAFYATPLQATKPISLVLHLFAQTASAELQRGSLVERIQHEIEVNQTQLDAVPALMFMISKSGRFLRWNHYFYTKFGYSHQQMAKMPVIDVVASSDQERVREEVAAAFREGQGKVSFYGVTVGGERIPVFATAQRAQYKGEEVLVGVALDMTTQMELEEHLIRSQGRLARKNSQLTMINRLVEKLHLAQNESEIGEEVSALLRNISPESVFVLVLTEPSGENMRIIASRGLSEYLRQMRSVVPVGEPDTPIGLATRERRMVVFHSITDDQRLSPELRVTFRNEGLQSGLAVPLIFDNEVLGVMAIAYRYRSQFPKDELDFVQTIANSLSLSLANSRQFALMQALATTDTLTDLPNRNAFMRSSRAMLRAATVNGYCTGLVLVDLDRFKEINDTLDHQIGDKLLKLIGPRLEDATSQIDAEIFRIGGDEFGVLVKDKQRGRQTRVAAEVIRSALQQSFLVEGLNLEISSSIGVMLAEADSHSASELLRRAELAMYQAKATGGGVAHFEEQFDEDRHQRFVIMAEMADAIRENQLLLHYQPRLDCRSGKVVGCEALVRWQHRHYGIIPPGRFVPLVELTQHINPLTEWVLKEALTQLQEWQRMGYQFSMSINLASRNLADSDFIAHICNLIAESGIAPHKLEFELTESQLLEDLEWAGKHLTDLSRLGFHIALDDYGTGYSSLTYLKHLPLDTLKIDQSFISGILLDPTAMTIARSTIELAHDLGMQVVAEGVEDAKTQQWLTDTDCDQVQGFWISQPRPAEEFIAMVNKINDS